MATFKPVIRTKNEFNTVYIRISTKAKQDYIKTAMIVHKSAVENGEITDYAILANCYAQIKKYVEKLSNTNTENWTASDIKKLLLSDSVEYSFTDFSKKYILKMKLSGRRKPASNYETSVNSLLKYYGKEKLNFSEITSKKLIGWIESLSNTKRVKNLYPICIKKIFEEGCNEYNDYDNDIIRIKNRPFKVVKIPAIEASGKRYADAETIRKILSVVPEFQTEQLAHDVSILILSLAGINTVDLYNVNKNGLKDNYLYYNRIKTANKRKDKAAFQIKVRDEIKPLFEKYKGNDKLFIFSEKYYDSDCFSAMVNKGLRMLCEKTGVQKITAYWLRHTWATIARNHCDASMEEVAFCLNHSSAHRITEDYIEKSFEIVDKINEKVLNYIFNQS